jgi:hypothetical protein
MTQSLRLKTEPTADADEVKIIANRSVTDGRGECFDSAAEAVGHPVAEALFAIPGVVQVYLLGNFIRVRKTPGARWHAIGPPIQASLHRLLG